MAEPVRAVVLAALADLWDQGCPIASPDDRERLVDVGLRRWHSFHRRHPRMRQPSQDARIRDLVRGLVEAVEAEPRLVGPLLKDYECVAEAIAAAAVSPMREP
ncbi:hypothetical protein GA0074695_0400 [Micromonospora viridifaciens]|uniref:Uncharacterized protein n=1 Tax=Micromonospora viridifaciens TaxID=1881 RepID=A0A1C4UDU0_MICVI|nr:hypothetical protein [Micromonospora viridifaciens]SCE69833.1 hypothetical protein GA0074695_0400 [Micromonospora viridifaciens]